MKKRQSILGGSLLLMASAAAAKLLGAMFRIPLTAMLGGEGMGYFSSAYGLFLPIFSLSVTGMNTALAAMTARLLSAARFGDAVRLRRSALRWFGAIGLCGGGLLYLFSEPICRYVLHNAGAVTAVRCFAPAIFFCCINAGLRGAHEGQQNMLPTAVSQMTEGIARLVCGLWFCGYVLRHSETLCTAPGASTAQAAAAAAILGVTCSVAVGTGTLLCFPLPHENGTKAHTSSAHLLRALLRLLIPVSATALVTNLTSVIDLVTGMRGLAQFSDTARANFLYGAFSGLAVTVFGLVPSVTNMLGKGALPAFSEAYTRQDKKAMKQHLWEALYPTALLAVPAGLGMAAMPAPILMLLFSSRMEEVSVAAAPLAILGIAVIPLALSFPLMSMLQAADAAGSTAVGMLLGAGVKLVSNLVLIPRMGLCGMAVSTLICDGIVMGYYMIAVKRKIGMKVRMGRICGIPMLMGGLCAMGARLTYIKVHSTIVAIMVGVLIYFAGIVSTRSTGIKRFFY